MISRTIPSEIAQKLRAEAGFGCAVCGHPILEYHHIIPWAERKHYEVEHMVALCRNHHQELGKQSKKVSYAAKQSPINIKNKRFKGYLVTNRQDQALMLGNTRFIGVENAVTFYEVPLFGHRIVDGEIRVNCFIPSDEFFPDIEVKNNNLAAMTDGFWDIEFKSNYVKFRRKKGEIFLSMDFRKDDVEISGRFSIAGRYFHFSPSRCDFGGRRIEGLTIEGFGTGIAHGDGRTRLLRPNFAMRDPSATYVRI